MKISVLSGMAQLVAAVASVITIGVPDASAFNYTVIYNFGSVPNDGSQPIGGLVQQPNTSFLWGTTCNGGLNGKGTVYSFDSTSPVATYAVKYPFQTAPDGACLRPI